MHTKQIVIRLCAVAVIACFLALVYMPMYSKIRSLKSKKAAAVAFIEQVNAQCSLLPQLVREQQQLEEQVMAFKTKIPDDRNLGEFLQMMASVMDKCGLKDQSVKPGSEVASGCLYCISVDVNCRGRLPQLFEFYKLVQSLDRLVRIESVKLENDKDLTGEISMETKAFIFYQTDKKG